MSEKHYSIKGLIQEHEEYEFKIHYNPTKQQITTKIKMPSDILATGIAFALADIPIQQNEIEIYLDEIKLKIRELRKKNATNE